MQINWLKDTKKTYKKLLSFGRKQIKWMKNFSN